MALSGTITGTTSNTYIDAKIVWSATQDTAANTSTVTASCYLRKDSASTSDTTGTFTFRVKIDGTSYSNTGSFTFADNDQWVLCISKSRTITHNSDGTRTCALDFYMDTSGTSLTSIDCQSTVTLNTIPRASTITTFDGFTISASADMYISLTTYNYSTSFNIDATLKIGTTTVATWSNLDISSTGNQTFSLLLTAAQQLTLLQSITTQSTGTATMYCQTQTSTSSNVGSATTKTATVTVSSAIIPSAPVISVTDTNETVNSVLGFATAPQKTRTSNFVQNLSVLSISSSSVTPGLGLSGASTVSYSITISSAQSTTSSNTQSYSGISVPWTAATVTVVATDTRGRQSSAQVSLTAIAYTSPAIISFTGSRYDGVAQAISLVGTEVYVMRQTGPVSSIVVNSAQKNYVTRTLRYKERAASIWSQLHTETSTSDFAALNAELKYPTIDGNLDIDKAYDLEYEVRDAFTTVKSYAVISTASVTMVWGEKGIGIGKIPEYTTNGLEVRGNTWLEGALETDGAVEVHSNLTVDNNGLFRLTASSSPGPSTTTHPMQLGPDDNINLRLGYRDIQSVNNGAAHQLHLNYHGGDVHVGASGRTGNFYINGIDCSPTISELWTGVVYMNESQTITLSENISAQRTGILLALSRYNYHLTPKTVSNSYWTYHFVPKWHILGAPGGGAGMMISGQYSASVSDGYWTKYLYISDASITGHAENDDVSGNQYNAYVVLRAVLGV